MCANQIKSNSIILLFFLVLGLSFVSCKNFLNAADTAEQIKASIAYANAPSYEIRVECDEGTGTIITETVLRKKVTDKFDVEFRMSSGYKFFEWKAYSKGEDGALTEVSSEFIKFSPYKTELDDSVYKVKVEFLKPGSGIVIKPVCYILPAITSYTPKTREQQYAFTPIVITFSCPMEDVGTSAANSIFKYSMNNIYLSSGGNSVTDYFESPYVNETKDKITLMPKYDLLNQLIYDKKVSYLDVNVKFGSDIKLIKDGIELPLRQDENSEFTVSYKYGKEKDSPSFTDFLVTRDNITAASNVSGVSRFEIKKYTGTSTKDGSFTAEEVLRNFTCNNTVYVWGRVVDEGSGVKYINITKTKTHDTRGNPVENPKSATVPYTAVSDNAGFIYDLRGSLDFCIKLEFEEPGIYQLDIVAEDGCENTTSTQSLSVIYRDDFLTFYEDDYIENNGAIEIFNSKTNLTQLSFMYRNVSTKPFTLVGAKDILYENLKFYCTYTDASEVVRYQEFKNFTGNENRKTASIDLDVRSVNALPFTISAVYSDNGNEILLGTLEKKFPDKQLVYIESNNNKILKFATSETGICINPSSIDYSGSISGGEVSVYASVYQSSDRGLYTEPSATYTKASCEALSITKPAAPEIKAYSITQSQKAEYLDVTVTLDENWKNNYECIVAECNSYKAVIFDGSTITVSVPTKTLFWKKNESIKLNAWGTKDGVSSDSASIDLGFSSEENKKECDNISPFMINPQHIERDFVTISVIDFESGISDSTKAVFDSKEYSVNLTEGIECTFNNGDQKGDFYWYDIKIPEGVFSQTEDNYVNVNIVDNAGNTNTARVKVTRRAPYVFGKDNNDTMTKGSTFKLTLKNFNGTLEYYYNPESQRYYLTRYLAIDSNKMEVYKYNTSSGWGTPEKVLTNNDVTITSVHYVKPNNNPSLSISVSKSFLKFHYVSDLNNRNQSGYKINNNQSVSCGYDNYQIFYADTYSGTGEYNMLFANGNSKDSIIVASDAPVFVHTLATSLSYSECKNYTVGQWESFSREVNSKQITFSSSDKTPRRFDILIGGEGGVKEGECYIVIAHYADDSIIMSEVMQR